MTDKRKSRLSDLKKVRTLLNNGDDPRISRIYYKLKGLAESGSLGKVHSAMQLAVCSYLVEQGYDLLNVEYGNGSSGNPNKYLIDVYARHPDGNSIGIEVESRRPKGLDIHIAARTSKKIIRYSPFADLFFLAYLQGAMPTFAEHYMNGVRNELDVAFIKYLIDGKCISFDEQEIKRGHINGMLLVNLEEGYIDTILMNDPVVDQYLYRVNAIDHGCLCGFSTNK